MMDDKIANQIRRQWLNPTVRGSFLGVDAFKRARNNRYTREQIEEALQKVPVFTQNRPVQKRFKRRKVFVYKKDQQWCADLIEIGSIADENNGNRYLLCVIDVLSKYAWVIPMKNKSATTTWSAFSKILKSSNRQPKFLQVDKGNEFLGTFKKNLHKLGIRVFKVETYLKSSIVERFNRTIRERLSKYTQHRGNNKILKVLPLMVRNYNNTVHSSTKFRPTDVTDRNEHDVWRNLYGKHELKATKPPKFEIGDKCLISIEKNLFEKGYSTRFKPEIFTITGYNNSNPRMYYISDEKEELEGGFYEAELSRVRY